MRGKFAMPVIAALLLLATVGGTASAAPPEGLESYDAGAETATFRIGLAGQEIAGGVTIAQLTSEGPAAYADGAALLLAGTGIGEAPSASPDGPATNEDCQLDLDLPDPLDTAGVEIGCVTTAAPDAEHSSSVSQSTTIDVLGSDLSQQLSELVIGPLVGELGPVLEAVDGLLEELCGLLGGILGEDCSLSDVVDQLTDALVDPDSEILTIIVAPGSSSTSADNGEGVVAHAISEGAVVKVLPNALLFGTDEFDEPNAAVTITLAASEATVTADPVTGELTTTASAAQLVDIAAGDISQNALGELLGLDDEGLISALTEQINGLVESLADANLLACDAGGPLEDVICLSAAQAQTDLGQADVAALNPDFDFGEGTMGAYATALELQLLSVAQDGGLVGLALSQALAAANATPAGDPPPTSEPPVTLDELPRTGSSDFTGIVLAIGLGLGAVAIRMRRRTTVS